MNDNEVATIRSALTHIPNHDRDVWIRVGAALRNGLGEDGWPLFNNWSRGAASYRRKDAEIAWRSFRQMRRVTVRTLFYLARQHGWRPDGGGTLPRPKPKPPGQAEAEARAEARRVARAKAWAEEILRNSEIDTHPYLAAKGFPDHEVLTYQVPNGVKWEPIIGQRLFVVPILDADGATLSVQLIRADGGKLFLPGASIRGGSFPFGGQVGYSRVVWYCEGYATALSIQAALRELRFGDRIVVCFSDGGVRELATDNPRAIVMADHDGSGAGEAAARWTGRPWRMPPEVGDWNDFQARHGVEALVQVVRKVRLEVL